MGSIVLCCELASQPHSPSYKRNRLHTNLIQLNGIKLSALLTQQLLRSLAVRAITLAEDGDSIIVDDLLRFGLGGGSHGGSDCRAEKSGR